MKAVIEEYGTLVLGVAGAAGMIGLLLEMFWTPGSMLQRFIEVWASVVACSIKHGRIAVIFFSTFKNRCKPNGVHA